MSDPRDLHTPDPPRDDAGGLLRGFVVFINIVGAVASALVALFWLYEAACRYSTNCPAPARILSPETPDSLAPPAPAVSGAQPLPTQMAQGLLLRSVQPDPRAEAVVAMIRHRAPLDDVLVQNVTAALRRVGFRTVRERRKEASGAPGVESPAGHIRVSATAAKSDLKTIVAAAIATAATFAPGAHVSVSDAPLPPDDPDGVEIRVDVE